MRKAKIKGCVIWFLLAITFTLSFCNLSGDKGCWGASYVESHTSKMVFIRNGDVHIYDPQKDNIKKLTNKGNVTAVDAKRDGSMILYATYTLTDEDVECYTIETINYDGTGQRTIAQWVDEYRESIMSISCSNKSDCAYFSHFPHEGVYGNIYKVELDSGNISHLIGVEDTGSTLEGFICPSISPDGKKLACIHIRWKRSLEYIGSFLCVMDRDAKTRKDIMPLNLGESELGAILSPPSWSPDGNRIAFTGEGMQIWTTGKDGNNSMQVTSNNDACKEPDWCPDGRSISFARQGNIFNIPSTGGVAVRLTNGERDVQGRWFTTWRSKIQKGDILLHRDEGILTHPKLNLFYTHAGIYLGDGLVAEARPDWDGGVAIYPIEEWDYPRDTFVAVFRVTATKSQREAAADWARAQAQRIPRPVYQVLYVDRYASPYSPFWYCSELVWAAYYNQGIDLAEIGGVGPAQSFLAVSPDHLASDDDVRPLADAFHHEFKPSSQNQGMAIKADCPVDLELIDPDGGKFNKQVTEVSHAYYFEMDVDNDGESEDVIVLEKRLLGEYRVKVTPEVEASPDDVYSLEASVKEFTSLLAEGVKVKDIPSTPYVIDLPEKTWYLAEGCTAAGMQTYVLVQNPNPDPVTVNVTYMTGRGPVPGPQGVVLPGNSRCTFLANHSVPNCTDVSTRVTSEGGGIICERAMYGPGMSWAHDSVGIYP